MTDKMIFGLLLVVLSMGEYGCSLVEINATTFAELPPLFGLDDWAGCQGEDDVWCIVDAALVSDEPSAALTLLQEYSQQTQKHYNRSQVHRGLCVSRCGAEEDGPNPWRTAAERCLNQELTKYGLQASVESVSLCTRPQRAAGSGARALAALAVVLVALVLLATALHVLGERCAQTDEYRFHQESGSWSPWPQLMTVVLIATALHVLGERCAQTEGEKAIAGVRVMEPAATERDRWRARLASAAGHGAARAGRALRPDQR
ncbi:hypothetical protein ABMA28_006568 [Loxostege sticticalis]|uniref:Uncharacterized protein n=1 Tax=Loxostege sticticalis TaxID=481309 RepID=A0ABD0SNU4_LOXSC